MQRVEERCSRPLIQAMMDHKERGVDRRPVVPSSQPALEVGGDLPWGGSGGGWLTGVPVRLLWCCGSKPCGACELGGAVTLSAPSDAGELTSAARHRLGVDAVRRRYQYECAPYLTAGAQA